MSKNIEIEVPRWQPQDFVFESKTEYKNPFNGERKDAGRLTNGIAELIPPVEWDEVPVVLHVSPK